MALSLVCTRWRFRFPRPLTRNRYGTSRGDAGYRLTFSQPCGLYLVVDLVYRSQRAERRSLLPGNNVAHVVTRENNGPIRLDQGFVTGICMWGGLGKAGPPLLPRPIGSYPRTFVVGVLTPGHVHRLFQFLAVAGMQPLHRLAAFFQFLCQRQILNVGVSLIGISADQDTSGREHAGRRKPDRATAFADELQPAKDVVILLPEAPAFPGNLVSAGIRAFVDHLFVWRAEIVGRPFQNGERHGANAVVGLDRFR